MKRLFVLLLLAAMALNLVGCVRGNVQLTVSGEDLLSDITPNPPADPTVNVEIPGTTGPLGFGLRLLQTSAGEGENILLSPISVLYALAMTANGARGETLRQMEQVMGMSVPQLNSWFYSFDKGLDEKQGALKPANSIWFTDHARFTVEQPFLQTVADYYNADIYRVPFDAVTCRDINSWVNEKTDGMIPQILDEVSDDAVMYLVNALAFEAGWAKTYDRSQVRDGEFTTEEGAKRPVEMLHSEESLYIQVSGGFGVMKYYEGGDYAFVALLPDEGGLAEMIASLDGAELEHALRNPTQTTVLTAIPKFETEYGIEMSGVLETMGMPDAFRGDKADLSGLGSSTRGDLYISRVLHKTFLALGEQGTKAGAATIVEVIDECAVAYSKETKTVFLDRPFVYMIIDTESCAPLFFGTMMDPA